MNGRKQGRILSKHPDFLLDTEERADKLFHTSQGIGKGVSVFPEKGEPFLDPCTEHRYFRWMKKIAEDKNTSFLQDAVYFIKDLIRVDHMVQGVHTDYQVKNFISKRDTLGNGTNHFSLRQSFGIGPLI